MKSQELATAHCTQISQLIDEVTISLVAFAPICANKNESEVVLQAVYRIKMIKDEVELMLAALQHLIPNSSPPQPAWTQ